MPLYSYECSCGHSERDLYSSYEDRNRIKCRMCGDSMSLLPSRPRMHFFRGGIYEHIASEPMQIDTPEQLHKACADNDAYSPYLNDSPLGRGLRKKEI